MAKEGGIITVKYDRIKYDCSEADRIKYDYTEMEGREYD